MNPTNRAFIESSSYPCCLEMKLVPVFPPTTPSFTLASFPVPLFTVWIKIFFILSVVSFLRILLLISLLPDEIIFRFASIPSFKIPVYAFAI